MEVRSEANTMNSFIPGLIEDYYDIQGVRISVANQIRSFDQGLSEQEEVLLKKGILGRLKEIEKDILSHLKIETESEPVYTEWLKGVSGVGAILSSGLIAWIGDIEKFATISKLWMYSGLGVDGDGKAMRRKKGEKINWNPRMKNLCWKLGESFVKTGKGYRDLYEKFRAEYDVKWGTSEQCGSIGCKSK